MRICYKMAGNGSGHVVQVDVDALSGAVSSAITQAIRQHPSTSCSRANENTNEEGTPTGQKRRYHKYKKGQQ